MCTVDAKASSSSPRLVAISSALERFGKGISPSMSRIRSPASSIARTAASRCRQRLVGDQALSRA
jgi:hypothetical protein